METIIKLLRFIAIVYFLFATAQSAENQEVYSAVIYAGAFLYLLIIHHTDE